MSCVPNLYLYEQTTLDAVQHFSRAGSQKEKKANQHSCLCVLKQRIILCEHQWYWAICRSPSPSRGGLTDVRPETRSKGNRLAMLVSVALLSPLLMGGWLLQKGAEMGMPLP
jgi:hypothetical protein